jgi:hypothetical protein
VGAGLASDNRCRQPWTRRVSPCFDSGSDRTNRGGKKAKEPDAQHRELEVHVFPQQRTHDRQNDGKKGESERGSRQPVVVSGHASKEAAGKPQCGEHADYDGERAEEKGDALVFLCDAGLGFLRGLDRSLCAFECHRRDRRTIAAIRTRRLAATT